jgi:hypothetical protein
LDLIGYLTLLLISMRDGYDFYAWMGAPKNYC